ncbi:MAG TPA: cytochrome c family protein [Xanthobacteraceae bacterium]|jgi:cytochrome c|nr:cytochrome c family protein [Xanthobacteraceae bacterium]
MRVGVLIGAMVLVAATGAARADGDPARGEKRFEECATCHTVERGVNNVGPSLNGLIGRKAGEIADFRYSPALKKSGLTWTPQTLDTFIADPQKEVPGNRMPFAGMPDAGDRADLIAYLQKATK